MENKRVSVDELALKTEYEAVLDLLERENFIRKEKNNVGRTNYEISHDNLIIPIINAKRERENQRIIDELKAQQEKEKQALKSTTRRGKKKAKKKK